MNTRKKGLICENIVCSYLMEKGYDVIARNFRIVYGEIDIVCTKNGTLCFVEVKSLSGRWNLEDLSKMVSPAKMRRIRMAASAFLAQTDEHYGSIRFDVAAVVRDEEDKVYYMKEAF